ncbi:MAG: DUF1761 domain-containing protein [Candidatus Aenigmatarchaeota archaeon]|nr:MAG: DUF1761 domain-containing protein [Candidatus Aenigmarchaeota archaeon]
MAITYVAVAIAALASFVLGMLWYGPLFGKIWMKLSGITNKQVKVAKKKNMSPAYVASILGSVVMAFVLGLFITLTGVTSAAGGMMIGAWAWLGFIAPVQLGKVLWEGKPLQLYALDVAFHLVALLLMGYILVWAPAVL